MAPEYLRQHQLLRVDDNLWLVSEHYPALRQEQPKRHGLGTHVLHTRKLMPKTIMPISRHRYEYIMRMVVAWANDVPFRNWFQLLRETYAWNDQDTEPDYAIIEVNGRPYLHDPLMGNRRPSLDMTTYMDTSLNPPSGDHWTPAHQKTLDPGM